MVSSAPVITRDQVKQAMATVLSSPGFARSARSCDFLRYVVEQTLNNRGDRHKGYTIGVDVFGLTGECDTEQSIVRVNAVRVRQKLADFYDSPEGTELALQIRFPKRSNTPIFLLNGTQGQLVPDDTTMVEQQAAQVEVAPFKGHRQTILLLLALSLLVMSYYIYTNYYDPVDVAQQHPAIAAGLEAKLHGDRYFDNEDFTTALHHYQQAVKRSPGNSAFHRKLGYCQLRLSLFDLSLVSFETALNFDVKGNERSGQVAEDLYYLGFHYNLSGQYDKAHEYLVEALEMAFAFDMAASSMTKYHLKLAQNHAKKGDYKSAATLLDKAFEYFERQIEPGKVTLINLYNTDTMINSKQGRFVAAVVAAQKALDLSKAQYGAEHSKTAVILNNLANLYHKTGQIDEAQAHYSQSLTILRAIFGQSHPSIAIRLINIATIQIKQKKFKEAEFNLTVAMQINADFFPGNSEETAVTLFNLGEVYRHQHQRQKALDSYRQALQMFIEVFDAEHVRVGTVRIAMADTYLLLDSKAKAREQLIKALPIYRKTYGEAHQNTREVKQKLESIVVETVKE